MVTVSLKCVTVEKQVMFFKKHGIHFNFWNQHLQNVTQFRSIVFIIV